MKKLKNFLLIIIVAAVIGVGATFLLNNENVLGSDKEEGTSVEEFTELSIDTDVITTNLASKHFAVVQFNILLNNRKAKEEIEMRTPEVRAAIISTVSGFTRDQLVGNDGIVLLEEKLFLKLGDILESGEVVRVLVTEYKIQ